MASRKWLDETVIPRTCREQFLPLQLPGLTPLRERGLAMAGVSDLCSPYRVERSAPKYYVLLYCLEGSAFIETDQTAYTLSKGETWVAPLHTPHRYRSGDSWRLLWCHFTPDTVWRLDNVAGGPPRQDLRLEPMADLFVHCTHEGLPQAAPESHSLLEGYTDLIGRYFDRELAVTDRSEHAGQSVLLSLWSAVDADPGYPWSLATLARRVHLTELTLNRLCNRILRTSPMRMVSRLRMKRAQQLLLYTDLPLEAIAQMVGYQTAFSFSRAFKKHHGISPTRWVEKKVTQQPPRKGIDAGNGYSMR